MSQIEFRLVQNRDENYHCDHIPFNSKGNYETVDIFLVLTEHREIDFRVVFNRIKFGMCFEFYDCLTLTRVLPA